MDAVVVVIVIVVFDGENDFYLDVVVYAIVVVAVEVQEKSLEGQAPFCETE